MERFKFYSWTGKESYRFEIFTHNSTHQKFTLWPLAPRFQPIFTKIQKYETILLIYINRWLIVIG
jgi:hypothetical protein